LKERARRLNDVSSTSYCNASPVTNEGAGFSKSDSMANLIIVTEPSGSDLEWNSIRSAGEVEPIKIGLFDIWTTPLSDVEAASVAVNTPGKRLLLNHNLHSVYLHETNAEFRELYRTADWIVIDGAPILWLTAFSARRRIPARCRITSTDWIERLPANVPRRLFVFGATRESNYAAVSSLRRRFPSWTVEGIDGYVDDEVAISRINAFKPDLVLIGLGMPLQERFLLHNSAHLPDATYATVGGAIDYLAGATNLAPRWVGRLGLELAWRLIYEPKRLAHRYLVEPILLLVRVLWRRLRHG
jgi:N-acetylglucosaminyldiphosphoundecaprenol N-acetyl-beta-D-mannosaminyltransferase